MANLPYDLPGNITGVFGVFDHANRVVNNMFMPMVVFAIFLGALLILTYKNYKPSDSTALAGLITFTLGSLLFAVNLLDDTYLIIAMIITILGLIWSIFDKN